MKVRSGQSVLYHLHCFAMRTPQSDTLRWDTIEGDLPADIKRIDAGLDRFNARAADLGAVVAFACLVRTETGEVIGGALARRWGECCELQQLWVDDDHRKCGIGREIVRRIEDHARQRGCTLLYLETFSFQSPRFYAELGYDVACEFRGFPRGVSKFIMQKRLVVTGES